MKLNSELERKILGDASSVVGVNVGELITIKKSKYGNRKTKVGDLTFDSRLEADRWKELCELQRVGKIGLLKRQRSFILAVNGVSICRYRADFTYVENGALVVEDAKGFLTDVYKLKKRLMKAVYGIEIRETRRKCKSRRRKLN